MKKFFQMGAILCGILASQFTFADVVNSAAQTINSTAQAATNVVTSTTNQATGIVYNRGNADQGSYDKDGYVQGAADASSCPQDHPCDQQTGECWCKYVHYEPCYYNTWRCVETPKYYTKKCCRYVPKYYEVQKCRMVPQYYNETCCRYEPEYYDTQECTTCKQWVCDKHCKYKPCYYYKHVCGDAKCTTPCPK